MRIGAQLSEEWFEIHTRFGACEVALNPSSREFNDLLEELEAPFARYKRKHDGRLPPGVSTRLAREAVAKAVLRDWRGMDDDQGDPLPFNEANALRVMEDPVIGDRFLTGVLDAARALWESFAVEVEAAEKN